MKTAIQQAIEKVQPIHSALSDLINLGSDNYRSEFDTVTQILVMLEDLKESAQENIHPESYCHICNGKNTVWYAENELFNKINGSEQGIMCPSCFEKMAEDKGENIIFVGMTIDDSLAFKEYKKQQPAPQDKESSCIGCETCQKLFDLDDVVGSDDGTYTCYKCLSQMMDHRISELEKEKEYVVKALEIITNPIKQMQSELKEGEQLNGMYALQLSNDANYLKRIAKDALQHSNRKGNRE